MMRHPCSWTVRDVATWARHVKLSDATIAALVENEVDGPTLVTLDKEELSSELGIRSLPARRYLWDLILKVRSQQNASDLVFAVETYKSEIATGAR
jgi:SAM domain (Sterile alpha motif)